MEYKAEEYISFIENGRMDKISPNALNLIARRYRELEFEVNKLNPNQKELVFEIKKEKKSKKLRKIIIKFWRYFFCYHKWKLTSSNRYNIKRLDGSKEGEVTLNMFNCELCGKDKLVPTDRTQSARKK